MSEMETLIKLLNEANIYYSHVKLPYMEQIVVAPNSCGNGPICVMVIPHVTYGWNTGMLEYRNLYYFEKPEDFLSAGTVFNKIQKDLERIAESQRTEVDAILDEMEKSHAV